MFDPIYRFLLFHLHRVAQAQCTEKQLLVLLKRDEKCVVALAHVCTYVYDRSGKVLTLASGPGDVSIMSIPAAPDST